MRLHANHGGVRGEQLGAAPHHQVGIQYAVGITAEECTEEYTMSQFQAPPPPVIRRQKDAKGRLFIDYKQVEELRRAMTQNGKLLSRKRLELSAGDQSMLSQAVKRARFMALLPFTNAAS